MPVQFLIDRWVTRRARPSDAAFAQVSGRKPAVVVTGGSRGIGLALARRFAVAGHDVVLIARNLDDLEEAAQSIASTYNVNAVPIVLDITHKDAGSQIDQTLEKEGYYLDILVNNAGIGQSGAFDSSDPGRMERMLELNVNAPTRLMRHVLPAMRARARGGIINIASLGGFTPGPYQAAYYASKAHIISLSEAAAYEMSGRGVRISVIAPGPVNTNFHHDMRAEGSLYRHLLPALSADAVARSAYRGYRYAQSVIVPGVLYKAMRIACVVLPNWIVMPFVARLLRPKNNLTKSGR